MHLWLWIWIQTKFSSKAIKMVKVCGGGGKEKCYSKCIYNCHHITLALLMHMSADIQINTSIWIGLFNNTLLLCNFNYNVNFWINVKSNSQFKHWILISVEKDSVRQRCNEIKADEGRWWPGTATMTGNVIDDWERRRLPM